MDINVFLPSFSMKVVSQTTIQQTHKDLPLANAYCAVHKPPDTSSLSLLGLQIHHIHIPERRPKTQILKQSRPIGKTPQYPSPHSIPPRSATSISSWSQSTGFNLRATSRRVPVGAICAYSLAFSGSASSPSVFS